jgi:hypothetical protein
VRDSRKEMEKEGRKEGDRPLINGSKREVKKRGPSTSKYSKS